MENKIDLQEGDVCLIYSEAFYDTEGEETEEVEILSIRGDTMEVHRNRTDLSPLNKYWTFTGNYFKPEWVAMVLYNKYDDDERPTYEEMEKYTKVAVGSKDEVNKALGIGEYSESHYDNYYVLTEKDIKEGKIKMDAYFVAKVWRTGSRDDSGALWHSLKTIARFGDKNPVEREIKALYNQAKALGRIYGVDLD